MILMRLYCALNKAVPRILSHLWGHCCQPHGLWKDLGNLQVQGQGHRQIGVLCPPWQHSYGHPPRWPMGKAGFLCSLPPLTLLAGFLALSSVSDHRTAAHQAMGVSAGRTLVHISLDVQHEHDPSHLLGFLTASAWTTAPPWLLHLNTQVNVVVAQSCLTLCSPRLKPARLLCPWDSPGKNTGVGCHPLLQGIFLTQGSNPSLLHCRQILSCLSHQGSLNHSFLLNRIHSFESS